MPEFEFVSYVLDHGVAVRVPEGRPCAFDLRNHNSCKDPEMCALASEVLAQEEANCFIASPPKFLLARCQWFHPLAVLPKGLDKCRLIHDYSAPAQSSINSHVDYVRTSYDKVDGAFRVMRQSCRLAKIDITAFSRHIPLDAADWELMAFRWDGRTFVDTRLNFGQRNAPEISWRFTQCIYAAVQRDIPTLGLASWFHVFVCCDDWLVVAMTEQDCRVVWEFLLNMLTQLGFEINRLPHKCIAPCRELTWLGLQLNVSNMTVALPQEKVTKALSVVRTVLHAKTVTRQQLDSLFGYLSYCSAVLFGGRAFLHGLHRLRFRSDGELRAKHHRVHVSLGLGEDMNWWVSHLELLNGDKRVPIIACGVPNESCEVYLDARGGSGGVGAFIDGGFVGLSGADCNRLFPNLSPGVSRSVGGGRRAQPSVEANHWELFAFVVLLDLFPAVVRDRYLVVRSDSMSAIKCVRDLHAGVDCVELAHLTRVVLSLCVRLNCRLCPVHVAGSENRLADPLSRGKWTDFCEAAGAWVLQQHSIVSPFLSSV